MNAIHRLLLIYILAFFCMCSNSDDAQTSENVKEDWFDVDKVFDNTWAIEESKSSQHNVSYLIAGSSRAIMFDTGSGENSGQDNTKITYKILEITDLPVTLLLSHFHFDHNQNLHEFESIAFPEISFLKDRVGDDQIYSFSNEELFVGSRPTSVDINEWFPLETEIDLGSRKIEIINLPGHTDESIVIIDHDNKLTFTGDFIYNGTLFAFTSSDLRKYLSSINRFIDLVTEDYIFYGAHGRPLFTYDYLLDVQQLLNCVVNDKCADESSTNAFGYDATLYKSRENTTSLLLVHAGS